MDNLIGFDDKINELSNYYYNNNLGNSLIFYGPKGIGKRTFINHLIHNIIKFTFPKNYEHHFNLFQSKTHPNIKILEKEFDIKTKKIKEKITIDQIRKLKNYINETPSIKNMNKFIIIDCADDLNINAANSFLKTLEEPSKNTYIFLISHQLSSLLPTLRSRCIKFKFNNHIYDNFLLILKEKIDHINEEEIKFLYEATMGSPGIAISLYNNNLLELLKLTVKSLTNKNINESNIELTNTLNSFDNDQFKNYLSILKSILIQIHNIKLHNYNENYFISKKFGEIINISSTLNQKNIINRLNFLSENENELFKYNLDKKIFMLNFLNN